MAALSLILLFCSLNIRTVFLWDYDIIFWNLMPYIYKGRDNKVIGIYIELWNYPERICGSKFNALHPKILIETYKEFNELLTTQNTNGKNYTNNPKLNKVRGKNAVFFPVMSTLVPYSAGFQNKSLFLYNLYDIPTVSVFARRKQISLLYKIGLEIETITETTILILLFSVSVSIILWVLENPFKQVINSGFTYGTLRNMWYAIVTLRTVGYGDIASKSFVGRVLMVIWMIIGLIVESALIAATANGYGENQLVISNKTVGTLRNSHESQKVMEHWPSVTLKEYDSFEDVLQGLRDSETDLSIINSDVASYLQDNMNENQSVPLSIVDVINITIPCEVAFSYIKDVPQSVDLLMCIMTYNHNGDALKEAFFKYRRTPIVEKVYIAPLHELLTTLNIWTFPLIAIACVLVVAFTYEIISYFWKGRGFGKCNDNYEINNSSSENSEMDHTLMKITTSSDKDEFEQSVEELLSLGNELAIIKEDLEKITDRIKADTIKTPNDKMKRVLVLQDSNYSGMIY